MTSIRLPIGILMFVGLASCVSPPTPTYILYREGGSEARFAADVAECHRKDAVFNAGLSSAGGVGRVDIYSRCMRDRGNSMQILTPAERAEVKALMTRADVIAWVTRKRQMLARAVTPAQREAPSRVIE